MKTEFYEVLKELRVSSKSEAEKGRRFEELMVQFFKTDPLYKDRFKWIKRWDSWEDRPSTDIGIDIVAEEANGGGICAMQCKFFREDYQIQKRDLEPLIAASGKSPYTSRIFIHTADEMTSKATKLLEGQRPIVSVINSVDLAQKNVDWPEIHENVGVLKYIGPKYSLRRDQKEARDAVISTMTGKRVADESLGIEVGVAYDRGKMVVACGVGKTFTALKIAEKMVGVGGKVLYLVPSISLLQQTMREWAEQRDENIIHSYIGICSDTKAGKADEDQNIYELELPVTTDPKKISEALSTDKSDTMRVVFCTYQSIDLVSRAQKDSDFEFDIAFMDEAHRTTGLEKLDAGDDQQSSYFVRIHKDDYIKAKKRLYMTATPRVYTEGLKVKAGEKDIGIFSMDDPEVYGPTMYELNFSEAVGRGLLSDYKVIVIHVDEEYANRVMLNKEVLKLFESEKLTLEDAAKIVGSAKALLAPQMDSEGKPVAKQKPLTRAIAFCNTIKYSKAVAASFQDVINDYKKQQEEYDSQQQDGDQKSNLNVDNTANVVFDSVDFETHHVDGKTNALNRRKEIEWLKKLEKGSLKILSNARCLTEGIDVPALDAALFMAPRNSYVDVIQAVGRVMRKAEGKKYGYIVLPIIIPNDEDPEEILNDNKRYQVVWRVLQALRSHDERLDIEINSGNFGGRREGDNESDVVRDSRIETYVVDANGEVGELGSEFALQLSLNIDDRDFLNSIHARTLERVGDRRYWENWAKDVADIASKNITRIKGLLKDEATKQEFDKFLKALQDVVSPELDEEDGISMLSQHLITLPVFESLFEGYDFAKSNPISIAMSKMIGLLVERGLEAETRDLQKFYESVQRRAKSITDPAKRQDLIKELYEKFFTTAFAKDAERLGIVYTPTEIVDFILHSADDVLQKEFDKTLSDEGVNIIEPFSGTGTFLVRLLQSDLIKGSDIVRKFQNELHANEILLLAYYISAISIEEAYHGRQPNSGYKSFDGIVLQDTFASGAMYGGGQGTMTSDYFPVNYERAKRQNETEIQVIVSNPPWSAWQKSAVDRNPNVKHEKLDQRIADSYAARSSAQQKASLYDSYVKAIRWASDRIGEEGIVAFVTNGGWLTGAAADGMRACLAEEFTSIYCFNLRGNTRIQGEAVLKEGDKIFGQSSRATVVITLFVKNSSRQNQDCKIYYKDIGDYLKRDEKLKIIQKVKSIVGIDDWEIVTPDEHNDWTSQRDPSYQEYREIGNSKSKSGKDGSAIFKLYSRGIATSRDSWAYSSSKNELTKRSKEMVDFYNQQIDESADKGPKENLKIIKWHSDCLDNLMRKRHAIFKDGLIGAAIYRPFFPQFLHYDLTFNSRHYQIDKIFPTVNSQQSTVNCAIIIAGRGVQQFSTFISNFPPDLHLEASGGQVFPRFTFKPISKPGNSGDGEISNDRLFDDDGNNASRSGSSVKGTSISEVPLPEERGRSKRGYL